MRCRQYRHTIFAVVGLIVALFARCGPKSVGRSNLGTTIGDREVNATLDGGAFISSDGGSASLTFGGGKLVVEKGLLKLDGQELREHRRIP